LPDYAERVRRILFQSQLAINWTTLSLLFTIMIAIMKTSHARLINGGVLNLKMTTRLTFLLLVAVLFVVTFGSTQDASTTATIFAARDDAGGSLNLTLNETKASFRNASSNTKSQLWRTHLALYLVNHPELNERQKKVISSAISLATPQFFETRSNDPDWKAKVQEPLRSLEEQAISTFSLNDATKIFATLHDGPEPLKCSATYPDAALVKNIAYLPLSDADAKMQWILSRFGEQAIEREGNACTCSTDSDWCPISGYCATTNCRKTQSGCGTLWSYPCNGVCR
jgi:hypothetical protein